MCDELSRLIDQSEFILCWPALADLDHEVLNNICILSCFACISGAHWEVSQRIAWCIEDEQLLRFQLVIQHKIYKVFSSDDRFKWCIASCKLESVL